MLNFFYYWLDINRQITNEFSVETSKLGTDINEVKLLTQL